MGKKRRAADESLYSGRFGNRLYDCRIAAGFKNKEEAAAAIRKAVVKAQKRCPKLSVNVSDATYGCWERAVRPVPWDVVPVLAQVFEVSVSHLLPPK